MFLREGISRKVLLRTPSAQIPMHEFQDVLCALTSQNTSSPLEILNFVYEKTAAFNDTFTHRSFHLDFLFQI